MLSGTKNNHCLVPLRKKNKLWYISAGPMYKQQLHSTPVPLSPSSPEFVNTRRRVKMALLQPLQLASNKQRVPGKMIKIMTSLILAHSLTQYTKILTVFFFCNNSFLDLSNSGKFSSLVIKKQARRNLTRSGAATHALSLRSGTSVDTPSLLISISKGVAGYTRRQAYSQLAIQQLLIISRAVMQYATIRTCIDIYTRLSTSHTKGRMHTHMPC